MELLNGRALARYAGAGLLGVVIGLVGTGIHRAERPWGLVLALATVLAAAVLVRAWAGWIGMLAMAMGLVTTVSVLAGPGPGGDVVVALDAVGITWYASAAVVVLAALAPRAWFSDRPVRGATGR